MKDWHNYRCKHLPIEKRPFRPHVTLQRKVNVPSVPLFQPNITCEFNTFSLYESVSGSSGVKYINHESFTNDGSHTKNIIP